jgi:hypothetical protein
MKNNPNFKIKSVTPIVYEFEVVKVTTNISISYVETMRLLS